MDEDEPQAQPTNGPTATQGNAASRTVSIAQSAPAGKVSMVNPAATSTATLIKILPSSTFTLEWSYSDLIATPTSLTIEAFCSQNGQTYTVATIPAQQTTYEWDIAAQEATVGARPWAEANYVFRMYGDGGLAAAPQPGRLSPNVGPQFAMYRAAAYTPLSDFDMSQFSATLRLLPINSLALWITLLCLSLGAMRLFRRR